MPTRRSLISILMSGSLVLSLIPAPVRAVARSASGGQLEAQSSTWIADQLAKCDELLGRISDAQERQNSLTSQAETLEDKIEQHEQAIADAQETVSEAEALVAAVNEEKAEAESRLQDAQRASEDAAQEVEAKKKEVAELEAAVAQELGVLEDAVTAAEQALEEAKALADEASEAVDKLEAQEASGSFGFFDAMSATDALSALQDATYASRTVKGDAEDATSLDNMRSALSWIEACNQYRAAHGLDALLVTDELMAMAQSDTNYATEVRQHPLQFEVGENLAWGYSDPFEGWYVEEKALSDSGVTDEGEVGHYLNIIDGSYITTGFGVSQRNMLTMGQVFGFSGADDAAFTVDEYLERLDAYEDNLAAKLADAKEAAASAEDAVTAAEDDLADAEQELANAAEKKQAAQELLDDARAALAELEGTRAQLDDAYAQAMKAFDEAEAACDEAQDGLDAATLELESLRDDPTYQQNVEELASVRESLEDARAEEDEAASEYQELVDLITRATDLSNDEVVDIAIDDVVYDGSEQEPIPVVTVTYPDGSTETLVAGIDFDVAYADNVEHGEATATISGPDEAELGAWWGSAETNFHISRRPIDTASISAIPEQTYTGVGIKPEVTITLDGVTLVRDRDYSVGYAQNVNAGTDTALVVVAGINNYEGDTSATFTIVPACLEDAVIQPIADQTLYDAPVEPKPVVMLDGVELPVSDYVVSYEDNDQVGTGCVTVTAREGGNLTGELSAEFNIVAQPHVTYRTHVQNVGWQSFVTDGATAGTSGRSLRLEGIEISLDDMPHEGGIEYRTHVQNIGWEESWRSDGEMSGTSGRSLRLEAIQIRLTGEMARHYDVWYRVHAQNFGWMGWARNGASAGTATYGYRLEAIQVVLVPKGGGAPGSTASAFRQHLVQYRTHVQNVGWQGWGYDGAMAGTTGRSLRLEGIQIQLPSQLYSGDIEYSTHVQNIGWQDFVSNGDLAGTSGRSLRLEAIRIRLTGQMAQRFDVYYRVHAQNVGWMGWAKNGEDAGTAGYSYRLEGIQIVLVAKGGSAPGSTDGAFRQK